MNLSDSKQTPRTGFTNQMASNAQGKNQKQKALTLAHQGFAYLAEWTGLEPATPGVTGRYSNQLNYHSAVATNFKSFEWSNYIQN